MTGLIAQPWLAGVPVDITFARLFATNPLIYTVPKFRIDARRQDLIEVGEFKIHGLSDSSAREAVA